MYSGPLPATWCKTFGYREPFTNSMTQSIFGINPHPYFFTRPLEAPEYVHQKRKKRSSCDCVAQHSWRTRWYYTLSTEHELRSSTIQKFGVILHRCLYTRVFECWVFDPDRALFILVLKCYRCAYASKHVMLSRAFGCGLHGKVFRGLLCRNKYIEFIWRVFIMFMGHSHFVPTLVTKTVEKGLDFFIKRVIGALNVKMSTSHIQSILLESQNQKVRSTWSVKIKRSVYIDWKTFCHAQFSRTKCWSTEIS